ncbi:MAG: efflux RND transporter periplasmic adaptor subunit [Thermoanaerobaculia bacterium]
MRAALAACLALRAGDSGAAEAPGDRVYPSHLMVDQEVTVMARITGIVEEILAERGAVVARDQPLARLDARELDAEAREAKEEMELRLAEYERAKSLSESKVLSTADLDEKKAHYQVAVARHERVRTLRDYTVIRAPFAGVVTEKYARVGQKVIEDSNEPLFRITAFEPLLARVYLPEEQLLSVRRGDPVDLTLDRFPDARASGVVQFISPAVDPASGMFQVIVQVRRNPSQPELRPGVSVKVRFPRTALKPSG